MGMLQFAANTICRFPLVTMHCNSEHKTFIHSMTFKSMLNPHYFWYLLHYITCQIASERHIVVISDYGITLHNNWKSESDKFKKYLLFSYCRPNLHILRRYGSITSTPIPICGWSSILISQLSQQPAAIFSISPKIEHNSPCYRQPLFPACWVKNLNWFWRALGDSRPVLHIGARSEQGPFCAVE